MKLQSGFDAAVIERERDYLNRWPFAKEIYGIATTGPPDWSVRIGIYGEWGTGKSTVLNFVKSMADADHVVVSFNPWQFASTDDLWKSFVRSIFEGLEAKLGRRQVGWSGRTAKRLFGAAARDLPKIVGLWRREAGTALETGLSYAKRFLTFGPNDLRQLQQALAGRRIIVLIDDLDRTDPKLVPEMLFALKEIMDVPGMAFVCAFDPNVVGEVLGEFHPGFGDGLTFLDKIIDYPRWLPNPTANQLAALAEADAIEHCPYVPKEGLSEAVELLPPNPRAVRQFVRLLRLLQPQIERHLDREIHWPILLAANVIKVRMPKLAPDIFENSEFWHSIYQASFDNERGENDKREPLVNEEVKRIADSQHFGEVERESLHRCLWAIAQKLNLWSGLPYEGLLYQFHLAEEPCAVTWKEFGEFLESVTKRVSATLVGEWIAAHSSKVGRSEDDVFSEILRAAIHARKTTLDKAADSVTQSETQSHMERAETILLVMEVLILELGRITTKEPRVPAADIKALLDSFATYFAWRTIESYNDARKSERELLLKMVGNWGEDVLPLLDGVGLQDWEGHHDIHGPEWRSLIDRLRAVIKLQFASWIIRKFRDDSTFFSAFLHSKEQGYRIRTMILDAEGPLWKDRRAEILAALTKPLRSEVIRGNSYQFLEWLNYLLPKNEPESKLAANILSDSQISLGLWETVISEPLNFRAIGSLRNVFQRLKQNGFEPHEPPWWTRAIDALDKPKPPTNESSAEE
jgi:hypothetical protein